MKNKTVNETSILWTVIIAFFPVWICLFLAACSNSSENETISISKKEYQALKGDSTALLYPKKFYIGDRSYDIEKGSDGGNIQDDFSRQGISNFSENGTKLDLFIMKVYQLGYSVGIEEEKERTEFMREMLLKKLDKHE